MQLVGGATLSVTLPKAWADTAGIRPGDRVGLEPRADGTLAVRPVTPDGHPAQSRRVVDATGLRPDAVERRVLAAYLAGSEWIDVAARGPLPPAVLDGLDALSRRVSGLEVVEKSRDRVVLQDIADASDLDLRRAFDRMYGTASALHRDVIAA